jgi:hypothetical protein
VFFLWKIFMCFFPPGFWWGFFIHRKSWTVEATATTLRFHVSDLNESPS